MKAPVPTKLLFMLLLLSSLLSMGCVGKYYLLPKKIPDPQKGILTGRFVVEFRSADGKIRLPFLGKINTFRTAYFRFLRIAKKPGGTGAPIDSMELIDARVGGFSFMKYKVKGRKKRLQLMRLMTKGYFVLELAPGMFWGSQLVLRSRTSRLLRIKKMLGVGLRRGFFDVKPGRINYIGDIKVTLFCSSITPSTTRKQIQYLDIEDAKKTCRIVIRNKNRSAKLRRVMSRHWPLADFSMEKIRYTPIGR